MLPSDEIVAQDIQRILSACQSELAFLAGKRVLLTGASGFVGSYLVKAVLAANEVRGHTPCRLYLPTRSLNHTRKKWPEFFDVENVTWFEWTARLEEIVTDSCDVVIHAAAPTNPDDYLKDPATTIQTLLSGTQQVIGYAAKARTARLLFLSSGAVYGKQPANLAAIPESYSEGLALTNAPSSYGEAKRCSESLFFASKLPVVIARLFTFVGPYLDQSPQYGVMDFIRQAAQGDSIRIKGDGSSVRTYCYASDLTISLLKLLVAGKAHEAYNVGSSGPITSILELAKTVGALAGVRRIVIENKPDVSDVRPTYIPDIRKLETIYRPRVALRDGIKRTMQSLFDRQIIPAAPAETVSTPEILTRSE